MIIHFVMGHTFNTFSNILKGPFKLKEFSEEIWKTCKYFMSFKFA